MERSFEAVLVEQCATTLAGVKPASLFRYQGADKRQPREAAARWAKELAPYGITIRVLKYCPQTGACLIYLYRAGWLRSILSGHPPAPFWRGRGMGRIRAVRELLRQLSRRLCLEQGIPHEIGVFLGYPWRMWWASSGTGAGTTPAADTGRPTATRRRHKSVSINTAAALPPAVSSSGRARPSRS